MKSVLQVLLKEAGAVGIDAAKAMFAELAVVAKRHGFNLSSMGQSCEPGVLDAELVHTPQEGVAPVAPAKPKAEAKPKAKAKAAPKKKGSKKSK